MAHLAQFFNGALRKEAEKLGYSHLCPQQERAVKKFVEGRDVFVSLPTGSGKSLCYCILLLRTIFCWELTVCPSWLLSVHLYH